MTSIPMKAIPIVNRIRLFSYPLAIPYVSN